MKIKEALILKLGGNTNNYQTKDIVDILHKWYISYRFTPFDNPTQNTIEDTKEVLKQWGRIE